MKRASSSQTAPMPQARSASATSDLQSGLVVQDLRYTYPGWPPTLDGATIHIRPAESGFLLGPSGIGKSTLLRCIAGLEAPEQGTVAWGAITLNDVPVHQRGIGLVSQEPALFPHLNVWQNVAFGLPYRDPAPIPTRDRAAQRKEAEHWLDVVQFPGRADARIDELSGGQRQRVALARTLAVKPRVVLLDEPFSGLDRALRDELGPRVKRILADQGVAALWVTHDEQEAFRLGDKVWRMAEGRCVLATNPQA